MAAMREETDKQMRALLGDERMKKLADPVMAAYAKEIGAEDIYAKINVA